VLLKLVFGKFKPGWINPCSSGLIPQILFDVEPQSILPFRVNVLTAESKGAYQNQFIFHWILLG
jgi:hypothetical protein